jgi:hypothetical protein
VPRWNPFRRTVEQPDTTKAAPQVPAGAQTFTATQVTALLGSVTANPTGVLNPLPRTDPMVAFGPGVPVFPAAIDPLRPDSGRPEPRLTEYQVSTNLPGVSDRLVPWKVLRDAAEHGGLPRRCIEIRKNEVSTLAWTVTITQGAVEKAQADNPGQSRADVEAELGKRLGPHIARCTAFWEQPNVREGEYFAEWVSKVLEEHLVLDALAIYPRYTYGGDLHSLEVIDGSTIKPLRDHSGGRPQPPNPAYQQLLWGFPRGEFLADVDPEGQILNGYRSDQLIYKRRNVRTWTQYGYSAVEQALEDVDVWLRRRGWIRAEYTDGAVPRGLLKQVNGGPGWTPGQVLDYERGLNDAYGGQTGERHRLRVLPPGMELQTQADVAERYRPEYDLFLIKAIAAHFDVTIAELGYTEQGGLGSTGWHEGQAAVEQRKGTMPTTRWLQQLITAISRRHLGMPPELEFRFLGLEEEDEASADQVAENRVKSGRMTYNEDRDRMGLPRFNFPEADMPMIHGYSGVIFVEGASKLAAGGEAVNPVTGPKLNDADGDGSIDAPAGPDSDVNGSNPEKPADDGSGQADAVKTELAAYRRWARKNPTPARPFVFQTVTKADAPDLAGQAVVYAAGDDSPKAGDGPAHWQGWDRDQDTADVWAGRIQRALTAAVNVDQLAERWLAQELVKADEPDVAGELQQPEDDSHLGEFAAALAAAWLTAQGIDLTATMASLLTGIWTEGWAIGASAARALMDRGRALFPWRRGSHEDAARTLTTQSADDLGTFRSRNASDAQTLARGRMHALAKTLARARSEGWTARQLAAQLRGVLRDESWARRTALTELSRASTEAARDVYTTAGLTRWLWHTEPGACPVCLANEAAGPRASGETWPDGSQAPPAHPNCRCTLIPA